MAKAAVEVLEDAGYRVIVPREAALLRPAALRLRHARSARSASCCEILDALRPADRAGIAVVGLEPSCVAVFRDELTNLLPARRGRAAALPRRRYMLERVPRQKRRTTSRRNCTARRSCTSIATTVRC